MDRHKEFQFGTNPMEMTDFEKSLAYQEKLDRRLAHNRYALGLDGRDGGKCYDPHDDINHFPPLKK